MKNIIQYSFLALMLVVSTTLYGQTPEKVVMDTKDYYQHGFNKTGTNTPGVVKTQEMRDSVTVTSVMKYFVLPDKLSNPDWYDNLGNIKSVNDSTTNLKSTFVWSFKNGLGSGKSRKQIIAATWNSIGIDSLKVRENPENGCVGKETVIPVAVIAKPTITFKQVGSVYTDGICPPQAVNATNKVSYNFPISITTSSSQVEVTYSRAWTKSDGTDGGTLTNQKAWVKIIGGNAVFEMEFSDYGKYDITITNVTDRVSRKSLVDGVIAQGTPPQSAVFTYNVMKPIETGPIFRIPNDY